MSDRAPMTAPTLIRTPAEIREELEQLIRDDLIGPLGGPEEELLDSPVDRYLLGQLAPRFAAKPEDDPGTAHAPDESADNEDPVAELTLPDDELAAGALTADSGADGIPEGRPPAADQLLPSTLGFTCAVDAGCTELEVSAHWGSYTRMKSSEKRDRDGTPATVWRRRERGGSRTVTVHGQGTVEPFAPDPEQPDVVVQGLIRERDGHRLVSLFLVNCAQADSRADRLWLLQAELAVAHPSGDAVFVRRPVDIVASAPLVDRAELAGLEMQYRDTVELAIGHGIGVVVDEAPADPRRASGIRTTAMPVQDLAPTEAPTVADFTDPVIADPFARATQALDMQRLAEADEPTLRGLLAPLADAYEAWIAGQRRRLQDPSAGLAPYEDPAHAQLTDATLAVERIRAGIEALGAADVAEAFRFANHTMWQQRVHTLAGDRRRRDPALKLHEAVASVDVPENRSWRPFQLAFVLLNLPSLADPLHPERADAQQRTVDLLFFPTGGGKTEAYLGLTAFTLAIRRLQGWSTHGRDGSEGVAVLMRYTLRLLTLQQFQRAAALLCACELRRRELYGRGETAQRRRWGETPMRIGLWVGNSSTPGRTEDAAEWVRQARQRGGRSARRSSPMQLARCPWCGSELGAAGDISVDQPRGRTLLCCSDTTGECAFTLRNSPGEGLPVVVVDEEIYHLLPALVIATVDKFARMPWDGRVQSLFGQINRHCERHGFLSAGEEHVGSHPKHGALPAAKVVPHEPIRPPDLIIQDELHLISGPLGSLVGLYETAVDELCSWEIDGRPTRPKVVASTATIRRAEDQVRRLFDRGLHVFPPPGLDARDSFFALQRDRPQDAAAHPGRRYLGICAPGRRYKQVLIRVYVAQLEAAWTMLGRQPGPATDAYMTLVGYFNSLRELGGMRRLVEDDVQNRMFGGGGTGRGRLFLEELTSRKSAADIPATLDQLAVQRLSTERRPAGRRRDHEAPSIDVLLATNMISVGVDVPRLGAMVVAGQPKSTSEYIQATSRVGRSFPGLVITVYNWARPRDLSHYETFSYYHRTLYRQVEALSVTPFAARALDRGLTGVLASLLRLSGPEWNANQGAGLVDPAAPQARRAREAIRARADDMLGSDGADALSDRIKILLDAWSEQAAVGQRRLVYHRRGRSDADVSLLHEPGIQGWSKWTVPTSMRNVEAVVPLALRERGIAAAVEPWDPPQRSAPIPDEDGA
jgi:hypothetical protein